MVYSAGFIIYYLLLLLFFITFYCHYVNEKPATTLTTTTTLQPKIHTGATPAYWTTQHDFACRNRSTSASKSLTRRDRSLFSVRTALSFFCAYPQTYNRVQRAPRYMYRPQYVRYDARLPCRRDAIVTWGMHAYVMCVRSC